MAAALAGIDLEPVKVETGSQPEELTSVNPLGKIPTMLLEDGKAVFDSRTITQHLNRMSGGALFPSGFSERQEAEQLEALADGICDCLLAHVYERRMRPAEKVHQPWLDLQWSKATRALDRLEIEPPQLGNTPHIGQIALRACLAYLDLRFAGQWGNENSKLRSWVAEFDEHFPELKSYLPA